VLESKFILKYVTAFYQRRQIPERFGGYNSSDWKAIDNLKNWSTIYEFQKMARLFKTNVKDLTLTISVNYFRWSVKINVNFNAYPTKLFKVNADANVNKTVVS